MSRRQQLHGALFAVVMLSLLGGGWVLASQLGSPPATAATVTQPARTVIVHHTRVVRKVVRGRVIRLKSGQRVIRVPLVVIHVRSCHRSPQHPCVRRVVVPAHTIPLRAAPLHSAVAIATPLAPVTVYATITNIQTVTEPAQTVTQTQTDTTTETDFITVTVTIPLSP